MRDTSESTLERSSRSDSGIEEEREGEELEVIVLNVGLPVKGRPYSAVGKKMEGKQRNEVQREEKVYR